MIFTIILLVVAIGVLWAGAKAANSFSIPVPVAFLVMAAGSMLLIALVLRVIVKHAASLSALANWLVLQ